MFTAEDAALMSLQIKYPEGVEGCEDCEHFHGLCYDHATELLEPPC
jgi:hypothetical protein